VADDLYRIKVSARAVIGVVSTTQVPVSEILVKYSLNEIAAAQLTLTPGQNLATGDIAKIVEFLQTVPAYSPVSVYATLSCDGLAAPAGRPAGFPLNKEFLVFEGYFATATGRTSRENNQYSAVLVCLGKTAGLLSATSFARGICDGNTPSGQAIINVRLGGVDAMPSLFAALRQHEDSATPEKGVWDHGVRPLLAAMINATGTWAKENADLTTLAAQTLQRVKSSFVLGFKQDFKSGLTLFQEQLTGYLIVAAYSRWINQYGGNIWAALRFLFAGLFLTFLPRVSDDQVIPLILGLFPGDKDENVWRTLELDDYWISDLSAPSGLEEQAYSFGIPYAVALIGKGLTAADPFSAETLKLSPLGYANSLPLLEDKQPHELLTIDSSALPSWLQGLTSSGDYGKSGTGSGLGVPSADNPDAKTGAGKPPSHNSEASDVAASKVGDDTAMFLLHNLMFQRRKAVLVGRLRFDIAPGSLLKIAMKGNAQDTAYYYAVVSSVAVNLGRRTTMTTFQLDAVRTPTEAGLGAQNHSLYRETFTGLPLTDEAL